MFKYELVSDSILIDPSSPPISHSRCLLPGVLEYAVRHIIVAIAPDSRIPEIV